MRKEKIVRHVDGKWSETLVKDHKRGTIAAFNSKNQAAFGKVGGGMVLYSSKNDQGKRESLGSAFLNGLLGK
jgi:hypothetical protein